MTDGSLLLALRHNTWANLELLAFCAGLPEDRLALTTPGTYGTLHQTLQHLVAAEQMYLLGLDGAPPPIEADGRAAPLADRTAPLAELAERERANGLRVERVLDGLDPARIVTRRRVTATAAVLVAQYVHHGTDHRAHAGTILGAHGIQPPDLDVWSYGATVGEVVPLG